MIKPLSDTFQLLNDTIKPLNDTIPRLYSFKKWFFGLFWIIFGVINWFSNEINKAPNTITRICNNESQPTLKFLREIAIALNVDIRELLVPTPVK